MPRTSTGSARRTAARVPTCIADEMVAGEICSLCAYAAIFNPPFGFPVVCGDCWESLTPDERKNHIRAKDMR